MGMNKSKKIWVGIALVNLCVVALLGFVLRSKILFSIPFIDFKYLLHAHSHYAFGGWVSLVLLVLMTYEILPRSVNKYNRYKWLLLCILVFAIGMLLSFPFQGYGLFSILFSILFIFTTYAYSYLFIKHLIYTKNSRTVKLLSISALVSLVLSSVGPFVLAYLFASKSNNVFLYRDSIYTYLHLQYNGFFTLAIMALFFNRLEHRIPIAKEKMLYQFAIVLVLTVIPSMFLSYLWHYPNTWFRIIAVAGSLLLLLCCIYFISTLKTITAPLKEMNKTVLAIGSISFGAFVLKMLMQSLTIFTEIGNLVFANRPMIIGFLHLVLLGFVSLYLIAHFLQAGYLRQNKTSEMAVNVFASAVVLNEVILMMQGLGVMLMTNSSIYSWMLWVTGAGLFVGSVMLVFSFYNNRHNNESGNKRHTQIITFQMKKI